MRRTLIVLLIGLASVTVPIRLEAQDNKRTDLLTIELGTDQFAAGQKIALAKPVAGHLLAVNSNRIAASA